MEEYIYVLIVVAVIAVAIFLIYKAKGVKDSEYTKEKSERYKDVNFCVVDVYGMAKNGTMEVGGVVKNEPIYVGDVFKLVDGYGNVIESGIVVEGIDDGIINEKMMSKAMPDEFTTLFLRTKSDCIQKEMFLKK